VKLKCEFYLFTGLFDEFALGLKKKGGGQRRHWL